MNRHAITTVLIVLLAVAANASAATPATCTKHNITLRLDPATHTAVIEDYGTIVVAPGWNLLYLKDSADIADFSIDNTPVNYTLVHADDTTALLADIERREGADILLFETQSADTLPFHTAFTARFDDPVENVQFSRENIGNEVNGTILDLGAYLSPAACYYPQGAETMARFSLAADIPAEWEAIADGNPVSTETNGDRKIQRFANTFLSDSYYFMAAPYVVRTTMVDSITVATYFFEADTSLCDKYLTATADYIRMYQELIGPYPFKQFTVAENFFPTGYGMPGWTLLGQSVLRLPFIITSSLGHEVLHNWWGNSVYVDYERGNWCEALTTYGADYRYKLLASPEAARDYRKDILKEYLSYVNDGNDFPLREFTSRSSAETRTIGYNKGMMVFHLIEELIGSEAFFAAWKQVYRDYIGKVVSWEDWIAAFEKASGQDLGYIIPEWVDRAGAPVLGVEVTSVAPNNNESKTVSLKITQSAEIPYHLTIPIRAEGSTDSESTTARLTEAATTLEFAVPTEMATVSLDPDFHIFRRLYPEEVEPIISAVLGIEKKALVFSSAYAPAREAFAAFGSALIEEPSTVVSEDQLGAIPKDDAPVILNPTTLPGYLAANVAVTDDSVTIAGQTYSLSGSTFVLAGQNWDGFARYMVILSGDYTSLPRVGQLVPHYGKYSYLVFAGAKNVAKGQWPVTDSPLRKALP